MPKVPSPENIWLEIFIHINLVKLGGLFSTSKQETDIVGAMLHLGLNVVPWRSLAQELVKLNKAWAMQMANIKMSQRPDLIQGMEVNIPNPRFF